MWQGHLESQAWQQVLILFRKRDEEGATSWMRPPPLPSEAAHGRRHASCQEGGVMNAAQMSTEDGGGVQAGGSHLAPPSGVPCRAHMVTAARVHPPQQALRQGP